MAEQNPISLADLTPAEWNATPERVQWLITSLTAGGGGSGTPNSCYEQIVSATPNGIFVVDCHYIYQVVNLAYLAWYGKPSADVIGRSLSQVLSLEQFQTDVQPHLDRCLAGAVVHQDGWYEYPHGRKFVDIVYTPYTESDGTISGAIVNIRDLTSLKQAQLAITNSDHHFRTLVENSTDVIVILDQAGFFCYASPSAQTVLGYSEADVKGKSALEFVHPDDQGVIVQMIQLALTQPNVSLPMVECRVRHCNGTWRVFEASTRNLLAEEAIAGIVVNCRDISDRKAIEKALIETRNKYRTLFETLPIGILVTDASGKLIEINPTSERIIGISNSDLHRRTYESPEWNIIRPDFTPMPITEYACYRAAKENRLVTNVEMIVVRPQGDMRWVNASAAPIPLDDYGSALAFVDVTEWKQAEAALYQREQEFKALAENSPDIISRFDHAFRHLYVNPAVEVATGLAPQTFIGKTNRELGMPTAQVAQWDAAFSRVLTTGQPTMTDFEFPTPQGLRDYEIRCVPEFAADGTVASILAVARDTTEQKRLERALRQRVDQEQALSRVLQAIRQSLDLDIIFTTATAEVAQLVQADRAAVVRYLPERQCWKRIAEYRHTLDIPDTLGTEIPDQGNPLAKQLKQFKVVQIDNSDRLDDAVNPEFARMFPGSWLLVPLIVDQIVWGSFSMSRSHRTSPWTDEQANLVQTIAAQLAIAIQQAQAFEQAQTELVERQQAEAHLRAALAEKEVLLKEIHHRVKNNLQIVSGLLQLQAQNFTDLSIVNALRESQNRVEAMSLIHKKLYTSKDLGQVDVADYINSLASSLLTTYQISPGMVELQVDVESVTLSLDQAIPCGLIINELVSNALKYAFPHSQPGKIYISLSQMGDELVLTIGDNGIGLPENVDWLGHQSLGLSLVYALATEQLEGTLTVELAEGTAFRLNFPQVMPVIPKNMAVLNLL